MEKTITITNDEFEILRYILLYCKIKIDKSRPEGKELADAANHLWRKIYWNVSIEGKNK